MSLYAPSTGTFTTTSWAAPLIANLSVPSVASAAARILPSWMRGSMSFNACPLMDSMICPFDSLPVAAAGDPSSMWLIRIVNAGWIKSIPIPTGPKRLMLVSDFVSLGRVENSPRGFL